MSYEIPLERGKIYEFARATQSSNAAYRGASPAMPVTFLTNARLVWEPSEEDVMGGLGFDLRRMLHGEEEYIFHGEPPRAGQTLTVATRLDEEWQKEGRRGGVMRFARIINEFRDGSGAIVAEQRSTIVETAQPVRDR